MSKLSVIRDVESPPGGWKYTVPETGATITAAYAKQLKGRVAAHLAANGHPEPDDNELEDAICRESGHGDPWCGQPSPKASREIVRFLTKSTVSRFLRTVMHTLRDRKFVDAAEARRRLAVCTSGNAGEPCPRLTSIGLGCRAGCSDEIREMEKIIGRKTDGPEPACGACGCLLRAKVRISNETLDKAESGDPPDYWEGCWRLPNNGS